ncbi:aspartyl/asparaginyl beta-hydroxylase domain-containing protein [Algoriphagus sp. SE2]|uniref:aspartyl/asparaginyl beta-hydroxylase domain-containing protein n=1 Tax=Algoriphagus sp. SE2 TaxID=3141536 RepID=UPI0031CD4A33
MLQIDRIKFPFQFDVKKLQDEVHSLNIVNWDRLSRKQGYESDWSVILLTAKDEFNSQKNSDSIGSEDLNFLSTPYLQDCPYISSILELFECNKYSVRLMKLSSGSEAVKHLDYDLGDNKVRVFVPVFTNPQVTVLLNDSNVELNEGECWYLKLSDRHKFTNEGKTDLIHLVLDLDLNEWIRDFLNV